MKKTLMFTLLLGFASITFAGNKIATDYYDAGEYASAKSYFLSDKIDAMDSYYLGQIYLKTNNRDSARYYFNKGLEIDPANAYNKVGVAALDDDTKTLNAVAKDKLYRKDVQMLLAVAEAYKFNNNEAQMNAYLTRAKKTDKKNPLIYIFEGDQLMAQRMINEAASKYENAVYFDPNAKVALLKLGKIYDIGRRTQVAMEYLNKAISIDPEYAPGLWALADIGNNRGYYPQALDAFNKYLAVVQPSPNDHAKYAIILFWNSKYDQTLNAISKAPNTFVMNRLKMYSQNELGNHPEALATGTEFFKMKTSSDSIIAQDYIVYADLLSKNKQFTEAADCLNKAYNMDTTKVNVLKDLAKAYETAKDYTTAARYYKIAASKPDADMSDVFKIGLTYYIGGTDTITDKALRDQYLMEADSVFNMIVEKMPDNYMGYFWRGRTNTALDPELTQGLAKPYYEKALEIMLPQKEERKKEIIEAYRYLGYYYYVKNDMTQAKVVFNQILELDPANETALQVIKAIDAPKKPAATTPKKGK